VLVATASLPSSSTGRFVFRTRVVASNTREAIDPLQEKVNQVVAAFAGDPRVAQERCSWLMNTIEDTAGRYSEDFRTYLLQFHDEVSRLLPKLSAVDEAELQRLQYQVRMRRDGISDAAQKELAAALPSPPPLSVVLSHIHEQENTYFVATVKNETEEQITNWAVQLEIPPLLVNGLIQSGHVPEESDKRKAVFRVETRPLWHGASCPFKVRYQLGEANHGLRTFNVRATAYVGGKLVAEQIKGIDELSAYFVPAVMARREALTASMARAAQPGVPSGTAPTPDREALAQYLLICGLPKRQSEDWEAAKREANSLHAHLRKHHPPKYAAYVTTTAFAWFCMGNNTSNRATQAQYEAAQKRVEEHLETGTPLDIRADDIIFRFAKDSTPHGSPVWMRL
jgi:hypothetical protein